jgi:hypothetical protein
MLSIFSKAVSSDVPCRIDTIMETGVFLARYSAMSFSNFARRTATLVGTWTFGRKKKKQNCFKVNEPYTEFHLQRSTKSGLKSGIWKVCDVRLNQNSINYPSVVAVKRVASSVRSISIHAGREEREEWSRHRNSHHLKVPPNSNPPMSPKRGLLRYTVHMAMLTSLENISHSLLLTEWIMGLVRFWRPCSVLTQSIAGLDTLQSLEFLVPHLRSKT